MKQSTKGMFWKAFFYLWLVYGVSIFVFTSQPDGFAPTFNNIHLLALLLISAVGLFGLAYRQPIGWRLWWKIFFFIQIAELVVVFAVIVSVAIEFGFRGAILSDQDKYFFIAFPLATLVQLVSLYGLYRYAFDKDGIWTTGKRSAK